MHMRQGCSRHKPEGCRKCPDCILFACMWIMRKTANHLKLLQGKSAVRSSECCATSNSHPCFPALFAAQVCFAVRKHSSSGSLLVGTLQVCHSSGLLQRGGSGKADMRHVSWAPQRTGNGGHVAGTSG